MNSFEAVFPSADERSMVLRTLKELGLTHVELAETSDLGEVYFLVPEADLARIGKSVANLTVKRAIPGRKTYVGVNPGGVPTVPVYFG